MAEEQVQQLERLLLSTSASSAAECLASLAVSLRQEPSRDKLSKTRLPEIVVDILRVYKGNAAVLQQAGRVGANLSIHNELEQNLSRLFKSGYPSQVLDILQNDWPTEVMRTLVASLHNAVMSQHEPTIALIAKNTKLLIQPARNMRRNQDLQSLVWLWTILSAAFESYSKEVILNQEIIDEGLNVLGPFLTGESLDAENELTTLGMMAQVLEAATEMETNNHLAHLPSRQVSIICDFIERGSIPEAWIPDGDVTAESSEEGLRKAKGSLIKFLVEVGADVEETIFWSRMSQWTAMTGRPDLTSCALLCFGNRARNDAEAITLAPTVLPLTKPLMEQNTPMLVQHALFGLLRNLSVPASNRPSMSWTIPQVVKMGVWDKEKDLLGSIQGGAIVLVKNLCRGSLENSVTFITNDEATEQLNRLLQRSEDAAIVMEGPRVYINVIRSIASSSKPQHLAQAASSAIINLITTLIQNGREHHLLINEAVVSFALLSEFGPLGTSSVIRTALLKGEDDSAQQILDALRESSATSMELRKNIKTLEDVLRRRALVGARTDVSS